MSLLFRRRHLPAAFLICAAASAQPQGNPLPDSVLPAQQMVREGKLEEALAVYTQALQATPDSSAVNIAAGQVLDSMGRYPEARAHFQKAIDSAPTARGNALAERAMAVSYAFEGNCKEAGRYERMVVNYYVSTGDAFQQGEVADEAGRICIDAGDLDAAEKWYRQGRDAGLRQSEIPAARKDLWAYRWEHAQARLAARRGNKAEAEKHVALAKAALEALQEHDSAVATQQKVFLPYLTGYVAFYTGDYKAALHDLQEANANDPFIQCLMGETYEKLGDKEKAMECYRKAAATTAHNPAAAYARPFAKKKLG